MVYLVDENGKSVNDVCFKDYWQAYDFLINVRKCGISNWYLDSGKLNKDFASMEEIIAYRKEARDAKNWDIADKIRVALDECGIVLKDSKDGTVWEVK